MSNEHTEETVLEDKPVVIPNITYTRMLTCILYDGGAEKVLEELHHRGVNEAYYYNVRGNPIGRASLAGGLPEMPKTEVLHAVVSADQADYIYNFIYHEFKLNQQGIGMISVNRLIRSSPNVLPSDLQHEAVN
jgi:nitrogen regulatory protein PII